jgi:hypothetical protein
MRLTGSPSAHNLSVQFSRLFTNNEQPLWENNMIVTVEELEQAISNKLAERQEFLDKANAITGAIAILNGLLTEAKKDTSKGVIDAVSTRKRNK